ncbi:hypothetical protein, partial [Xylanibacter rodentium]|uniref:hypothetical protein n=3 Tax=Xylanibacter rodentium TaxID=2736289 RepID=UPI002592C28A
FFSLCLPCPVKRAGEIFFLCVCVDVWYGDPAGAVELEWGMSTPDYTLSIILYYQLMKFNCQLMDSSIGEIYL